MRSNRIDRLINFHAEVTIDNLNLLSLGLSASTDAAYIFEQGWASVRVIDCDLAYCRVK